MSMGFWKTRCGRCQNEEGDAIRFETKEGEGMDEVVARDDANQGGDETRARTNKCERWLDHTRAAGEVGASQRCCNASVPIIII